MNKLFYILLALFCLSCEFDDDQPKSKIKNSKSIGAIDNLHEVIVFHDDVNRNTCYVLVPHYNSETYSISCVKDEMASPK